MPLTGLLGLAACGFSPLYGGEAGGQAASALDTVSVQNIPERNGQILRESLQTHFYAAGAPDVERYSLIVSYNMNAAAIGVLADTSTTRNRFTATANWKLTPIGNPGQVLASGHTTAMDAENIIDQQYFAAELQTGSIDQHLADEIAADIALQLSAWFRAHPGA